MFHVKHLAFLAFAWRWINRIYLGLLVTGGAAAILLVLEGNYWPAAAEIIWINFSVFTMQIAHMALENIKSEFRQFGWGAPGPTTRPRA